MFKSGKSAGPMGGRVRFSALWEFSRPTHHVHTGRAWPLMHAVKMSLASLCHHGARRKAANKYEAAEAFDNRDQGRLKFYCG